MSFSRNTTNPSPYDQVVVLSQSLINDAFNNMYILADDEDPIKRLCQGKQMDIYNHVDTKLNAPIIQLQVTNNYPELYFLINMISGTLHLDISGKKDRLPKFKDYDTAGWILAFPVQIARKIIPKTDQRFTKAVSDAGLDPSIFSLAQLYVDCSTSAIYEPLLSSFGTTDWAKEPPQARGNLDSFIQDWLNEMQESHQSVLGYAFQHTDDPDNPDPTTFPPTSVDYYVYPWKGENGNGMPTDNIPNNALCYLMMSGFRTPPNPVGLAYTGPYVNGEGGTYCMTKSMFWDQWMFPALQDFAKGSIILCDYDYPQAACDTNSDWPWTVEAKYSLVPNDPIFETLYFNPSPHESNTWFVNCGSGGVSKLFPENDPQIAASAEGDINLNVSFEPGKQTITIAGVSKFELMTTFGSQTDWDNLSKVKVSISWSFQLGLSSVTEGGLEISLVNIEEPHVTECTVTPGNVIYELGQDGIGSDFSSQLLDFMKLGLEELKDVLTSGIQNQHKLFLPGSGAFLMKNPVFNARGDLLVDLEYQGADPPIPPEENQSTDAKAAVNRKTTALGALYKAETICPKYRFKKYEPYVPPGPENGDGVIEDIGPMIIEFDGLDRASPGYQYDPNKTGVRRSV